jgi:ADP-ribosylglycohydrolase
MPPEFTRERLYDHVAGSLFATALGDAMGAATEQHQIDEIIESHGGMLRELRAPGIDTFSEGNRAGEVTDDSSQMFAMAQAIIEKDGALAEEDWISALLHWSQTSPQAKNMGPTTRPLLEAMARGESTTHIGTVGRSTRKLTSVGVTNGAAMRIAPAGLVHPGNIEGAVELAWVTCRPTHDTQIAAASAGAIAAGVARALEPEADVYAVVRATLEGAQRGEALGAREGRRVAGPSVSRRIEMAVEEALRASSFEDALRRIEATVGNSVMAVESAPAAIGIFLAAAGDPIESAVGGTNIGNDTDTIAAMACAMAGALRGVDAIPEALRAMVTDANREDIPALAEGLTAIAWRRAQRDA